MILEYAHFQHLTRNDREMTKNDQEMSKKGPRKDQERTKKGPRNDQEMTENEQQTSFMIVNDQSPVFICHSRTGISKTIWSR
jgi:hypothetical protein